VASERARVAVLAERTAPGAEETTAASKRLMALSDQLEGRVRRFRY
jgi:methyl-accepting chemotaxis protein